MAGTNRMAEDRWSLSFLHKKMKDVVFGGAATENPCSLTADSTIGQWIRYLKANEPDTWAEVTLKYPKVNEERFLMIWENQSINTYKWLREEEKLAQKVRRKAVRAAVQKKREEIAFQIAIMAFKMQQESKDREVALKYQTRGALTAYSAKINTFFGLSGT